MSTVQRLEPITITEYLDGEEASDIRHEYVGGVTYAMVGASVRHNLITGAIFAAIRNHLRGSACQVFQSDMKVQLDQVFYYPDVVVSCEENEQDARFLDGPKLVVEVLSPSTEAKDRLEKLVAYRSINTVDEYVLVSQNKIQIEIYRRIDNDWQLETCTDGDVVELASISLVIPIRTIYEDVLGVGN